MPLGDGSLLLVHLEHDRLGSALLEALLAGSERHALRLLDLISVSRRTTRRCAVTEVDLSELALAGIVADAPGLIGIDDAAQLARSLDVGESAAIILIEHHPSVAAVSTVPLLRDRIIDLRAVPASVANTVWTTAQRAPVPRLHGIRRRCTAEHRSARRAMRP